METPANEGVGYVRKRVENQVERGSKAGRRWVGRAAGVVVVAGLAIGVAPGVADAKPRRPSAAELNAAQQAINDAATQEGQVRGQLANAQAAADDANAHAALALDVYEGKQQEYDDAVSAADTAKAAAQKAAADLDVARSNVVSFARDSYMAGSTSSRITSLITSGSPAQMLERAALLDAAGDDRSSVLTTVTVVEHQATAAKAQAETALTKAADLKQAAATALKSAEAIKADAVSKTQALATQETAAQSSLQQAQQTLTGLQGQQAAANTYDAQQAAAAAKAATAVKSTGSSAPPAPSGPQAGPGSSSAAETAINAAMRWIGTPYAWGGGSFTGPTRGFADGNGNDDSNVVGFDCSGLTRYAYYQAGISISRQSTAQYLSLPKVSRANLQRGDLVFWAFNTSQPSTIHHVAIWLGDGTIIEAPESGERVRVVPMRWPGFIGGARPTA
jgi:cell wall-associated NlpC family hydrolase